ETSDRASSPMGEVFAHDGPPANNGAGALDTQAALPRHHFPDLVVDVGSPELLLRWRRASTFCKAPLKKSTSIVFSPTNRFSCRTCWRSSGVLGTGHGPPAPVDLATCTKVQLYFQDPAAQQLMSLLLTDVNEGFSTERLYTEYLTQALAVRMLYQGE